MKAPWELLKLRTQYYEALIKATLTSIGVPLTRLHFVRGTDFQLSREYTLDVYKVSSLVTEHDAKKAGAEVVKQVEHPLLSGLLYPCLQMLDEQYLGVDAQFGGVDQRKIFTFSEKYLPVLGYSKRIHLMNPMVPGLTGPKMSSSDLDSKIDLLDDPVAVGRKIKKAFCEEGNITENGLLSFAKMVLYPLYKGAPFTINRPAKYGGAVSYATYSELEAAFAAKQLYPADLKMGMIEALNALLAPIRKAFETEELQALVKSAYPQETSAAAAAAEAPAAAAAPSAAPAAAAAPAAPQQKKKQQPQQAKKEEVVDISRISIVVGHIVNVQKHPEADNLYIETVDLGPKIGNAVTVVSGLAQFVPLEELKGKKALFVTNLKPCKLKGVLSSAMILAASDAEHKTVEVVFPSQDSEVGERVTVAGYPGEADEQLNPKKKIWEEVQPHLETNAQLSATWRTVPLMTSKGECKVKSLANAHIK
jgi:tyrosyl-tRNA synthetase